MIITVAISSEKPVPRRPYLAENLQLLEEELEQDLNNIHTINFTPHANRRDWWMEADCSLSAWIGRDLQGHLEVEFSDYRAEYAE